MTLAEVMAAAFVLACATSGSLQIWAATAASIQQTAERQEMLERMDLDLLQLQAHWRREGQQGQAVSCQTATSRLAALAATIPVPPQLQREVTPGAEDTSLLVTLSAAPLPLQRQRLFTAPALGACDAGEEATP